MTLSSRLASCLLPAFLAFAPPLAALETGDIAFVGYNADGADDLAFVALAAIPAGTVIHFTDEEWTGTAWSTNTEAAWTWTASDAVSAGTVVTLSSLSTLYTTGTTASAGVVAGLTDAANNAGLAASGEAVFAYIAAPEPVAGTVPAPARFLAAIGNGTVTQTGSASLAGTGLAEGDTALFLAGGFDVFSYVGSRSGVSTLAAHRAAIHDPTRWITQDGSGNQDQDGTPPDVPFDTTTFLTVGTQLVVTEINSSQATPSTNDFWEVTNFGDVAVDLSGFVWDDDSRNRTDAAAVTVPAGTVLAPGASLVFTALDAAAFRTWWGLDASVAVVSGINGPGLGQNDGVALFDAAGNELFFFTYAAGGFTRSDGSASAGGHAGASAGGAATVAAVIDPAFGFLQPRYRAAAAGISGAFASTTNALDVGSPGTSGFGSTAPSIELQLQVLPASFAENAGADAAVGTVTRSGSTAASLEVALASSDTGEATVPATVTILAGQTSATFTVAAVNDSFPDGTVTVTLTATATGATPASAEVSVLDDGDVLVLTLAVTEIQSSQSSTALAGAGDFWELTNYGASAVDLSGYRWHDSGRSASAAAAYAIPAGTSIAPGESIVLTAADPTVFRSWWGIGSDVKVIQGVGAPGLGQSDGISLFDAGGNELLFFSYAAGGFTREDGTPSLGGHAGRSAGATADSQALIWVPTSGTTSPRYTFATGENYGSFLALVGADLGSPGRVEAPPVGPSSVAITGTSVLEGDEGTRVLTLAVERSTTASAFTVGYAVTGGTATAGSDYVAVMPGTLTFTAGGSASAMIEVTVLGDGEIETNETVVITLSGVVDQVGTTTIAGASAAGTITNDDRVPVPVAASGSLSGQLSGFVALAGAEIPAFDPASRRAFLSSNSGLQVVNLADPAAPVALAPISLTALGLPSDDVSSVAVRDGVIALALIVSPKTDPGRVAFLEAATGTLLGSVTVGANPDHLTFSPDGTKVLVAIEGELAGAVAADVTPSGVSIIDVSGGFASATVRTAGFEAYDARAAELVAAGVRLFAGGKPSTDFETEYLAVSPDNATAMVTLQEANAIAVLDIATATFTSIVPLGEKDFSGLYADLSDRDGPGGSALAKPTLGNPVFGLYMPDAIAAFVANDGKTYYAIANEGDDRDDFLNPDETSRVSASTFVLDPVVFPDAAALKDNARLGRLTVSNSPGLRGDTDGDGDVDRILMLGGRSFSILDDTGSMVWDSGDLIERIIAAEFPSAWDDSRSDNKGAEPEGITVATIGARTYAFVGLERTHQVMVFDVTRPTAVSYVATLARAGDLNPEGLVVVPAAASPNGKTLLLVASEVSSTLTVFSLEDTLQDFDAWLRARGYASSGSSADADADGIPDLLEYFFDLNPADPADRANLPKVESEGDDVVFAFTRNGSAQPVAELQVTTDLVTWRAAIEGVDYERVSETLGEGSVTVRYRLLQSEGPARVFRLDVR